MAEIRKKFENVPEDNSLTFTTSANWDDRAFDDMITYTLTTRTSGEIIQLFNTLKQDIQQKTPSKYIHHKILQLAVQLASPTASEYKPLLTSYPEGVDALELGLNKPNTTNPPAPQKRRGSVSLPDPNEPNISEEEKNKRQAALDNLRNDPFSETERHDDPFAEKGQASSRQGSYADVDIKYATFIGGVLMKLVTKSKDNIRNSWKTAQERFRGFYLETPGSVLPTPSEDWLKGVKEYINHDKKAIKTLLKVVRALEAQYDDPDSNEAGIIRFLFVLPLSYAGMHAYKLFLAVKLASGKTNKFLLNSLMHPRTVRALNEIYTILSEFENRAGTKKSGKFRYARLIGPQYFMSLQTKVCKPLVYCLASLLHHYQGEENPNFSPDKIEGLQTLSLEIKQQMDEAARLISQSVSQEERDLYSTYMYQARGAVESKPKVQIGIAADTTKHDDIFGED